MVQAAHFREPRVELHSLELREKPIDKHSQAKNISLLENLKIKFLCFFYLWCEVARVSVLKAVIKNAVPAESTKMRKPGIFFKDHVFKVKVLVRESRLMQGFKGAGKSD